MSTNSESPIALKINIIEKQRDSKLYITFFSEKYSIDKRTTHPFLNRSSLKSRLISLQGLLKQWAESYKDYLDPKKGDGLTCNPEKIQEIWFELAKWGRIQYLDFFAIRVNREKPGVKVLNEVAEIISQSLKEKDRIIFNSIPLSLPWALFFTDDIPEVGSGDFFTRIRKGFWGTKYCIENSRRFSKKTLSVQKIEPSLSSELGELRLTVAINRQAELSYKTQQEAFFNNIKAQYKLEAAESADSKRVLRLHFKKEGVIDSLVTRQEPQHLYYFFCHHRRRDGKSLTEGFEEYDPSLLIIEGNENSTEGAIGWDDLRVNSKILKFEHPTVVVLNACESVQEIGNNDGFLLYFTEILDARALIGTQAKIPAVVADEFGKYFVSEFLKGFHISEIIYEFITYMVGRYNNPFGLYYSLFGDREIRLINSK